MASVSSAERNPQFACFLDLPAELRNKIYKLIVTPTHRFYSLKGYRIRYTMLLPLIVCNAHIANELLPMFFAEKAIHLESHTKDPHQLSNRRRTSVA